jgi:putative tryptophan/tyrosine transport system substrate-binding protein
MEFDRLRRREFITLLGGTAAAWPVAARAQQDAMPVIGFLNGASPEGFAHLIAAYRQGLKKVGYVEGENVAIEYRWARGQYNQLPALAADLVHRRVAVITTTTNPAAPAAKAATATIPIVFVTGLDPVQAGLVASLSRPGGNLTGVATLTVELGPKRLELLHELVPPAAAIAILANPANPSAEVWSKDMQAAARTLQRRTHLLQASTEHDIDNAFATLVQLRAGGLVIVTDPFFTGQSEQLAVLAARHSVPAIFQFREFTAAGGLMSYGPSLRDSYRLAGTYTGRILKGEKPSDLPVQQSTEVDLYINLKTARALGITIPLPLSGRADEIFE